MRFPLFLFALLFIGTANAQLNRWDGSDINKIQHQPNGEATSIRFTNSSNELVHIYWLKPSGEETKISTVQFGGESTTINTYTNHYLVLRNERNVIVGVYQNAGTTKKSARVGNIGVESIDCSEKPGKSGSNGQATEIDFTNMRKGVMNIYWIGYDGKEILYKSLAVDDTYRQSTFTDHYWVLREENGDCIDVCYNPGILREGAHYREFTKPNPAPPKPAPTTTPEPPKPEPVPTPTPESNVLPAVNFNSNTYFRIVNKSAGEGKGMACEKGYNPIMQSINTNKTPGWTTENNTTQYWRFQSMGYGNRYKIYYDIFTAPMYLTATSNGNIRLEMANTDLYQKGEQEWIIEQQEDGYYRISSVSLQNESYKYLFCDASKNSLFISSWKPPQTKNGRWYFRELGSKSTLTPKPAFGRESGFLTSSSGQCLYPVFGWRDYSGDVLEALVIKNSGDIRTRFQFTPQPDGTFGISFSIKGQHFYLDGSGIQQYLPNSSNSNDNYLASKYNRWRAYSENGNWRFVNAENGKHLVLQSVTAGSSSGRGGSSSGNRYTGLRVSSTFNSGEQLFQVR